MDNIGLESCPLAGFSVSRVGYSVSVTRELVISYFEKKNVQRTRQAGHKCVELRTDSPVFGS
jgi:hypothetical protein